MFLLSAKLAKMSHEIRALFLLQMSATNFLHHVDTAASTIREATLSMCCINVSNNLVSAVLATAVEVLPPHCTMRHKTELEIMV